MPKMKLRVLTHSERQTFRNCRNRWGYAYVELLRPEREHAALKFGSLYHKVIARVVYVAWQHWASRPHLRPEDIARYASAQAMCMMWDELKEMESAAAQLSSESWMVEVLDEIQEARAWLMFQVGHYFESTVRDWTEYTVLGCELPFDVPLRDSRGRIVGHVRYQGMIDLLLMHNVTRRVIVSDHKSLQSFAGTDRKLQLDDQTTGYLYAARELHRAGQLFVLEPPGLTDASFCGVSYNLVRKAAPTTPRVNRIKKDDVSMSFPVGFVGLEADEKAAEKRITEEYKRIKALEDLDGEPRGRVSTAACDTLARVYQAALEEQYTKRTIPWSDDQRAMLESLRARGDTYFMRIESVRSPRDLERWCAEYLVEQAHMRAAERDEAQRTRNPWSCTGVASAGCPYQALCEAGEPASARDGKPVFGYVRVAEPHQEIARGKQEKEQWEERRRQREAQEQALEAAGGGDGHADEDQEGTRHGEHAGPEGAPGERGRGGSAEADYRFF